MAVLLAGTVCAAAPGEAVDEKRPPAPQTTADENNQPVKPAPSETFTPSEKVGADSAVSFPVDI
jgi:hypothetical protein